MEWSLCPEVADRPGSHCSDENNNAHMPVRGVCCLPDTALGTSHVLSSVPSEPSRTDSAAPLHGRRMETSGDGSHLERDLGGRQSQCSEQADTLSTVREVSLGGAVQ